MLQVLKLVRAETLRSLLLTVRYPLELVVGLGIMYSIFMGLFLGASALVRDPQVLSASLDGFVISYVMWFFVISAISRLAFQIQMEAQIGVLEQIVLNYPRLLLLLLVRSVVDFGGSLVVVAILLLSIMATTGKWLTVGAEHILPLLLLLVLTVAGIYGFGLIFAGMALVYKRIGQVGSIVQFAFFLLAYLPIEQLSTGARVLLYALPLTLGLRLIKLIAVQHGNVFSEGNLVLLLALALDSALYLLAGAAVFRLCERQARLDGRLGQY